MIELAAWIAVGVLVGLVVFQLLLVAGQPLGEYAWGGARRILPTGFRVASAVAVLIYAAAAVIVVEAAGITDVITDADMPRTAVRVLAVFFGIGVIMNAASRSPKERVMALVALVLAVLFALVGWL